MSIEAAVKLPLDQPDDPETERLKEQVRAYLKQLRFEDPELIDTLVLECLHRVRRGRRDLAGLLRRALEEAQQRLDRALAQALNPHLPEDAALVIAARAALLLTSEPIRADDLIRPAPEREALLARLKAQLPVATPPEAASPMPAQDLKFWL